MLEEPIFYVPLLQLSIAMLLGMLLGLERSIVGKKAGMRTFALVAVGSCLFILVSNEIVRDWLAVGDGGLDPLRVAAGIVTGVGFLGAGMIIYERELIGLTTAASLWVASGIGMAVGFELYLIAIATTLLTLLIFTVLWHIEQYLARRLQLPDPDKPVTVEEEHDYPEHI